jgi:hypothetical protein
MLEAHGDALSFAQKKRLRDALGLDPEDAQVEIAEEALVDDDDIPF